MPMNISFPLPIQTFVKSENKNIDLWRYMQEIPLLSICIPSYNRPIWLARAIQSIVQDTLEHNPSIEIIISDDSSDQKCADVAQSLLKQWGGRWKYIRNQPSLGMAENWNSSIYLASGQYVLVLHDDDFLLPEAIFGILNILRNKKENYSVFLFGVKVVNEREIILKKQIFKEETYLAPKEAVIHVLSNSSFVRFPAIVIEKAALDRVGYFNPQWNEPADIELWTRLFSRYGVYCSPVMTCAYTVHDQALTMAMFNSAIIERLLQIFEQAKTYNLLTLDELENCQSLFFYQFILAGSFRMLRRGRLREFRQVMSLFQLNKIVGLPIPRKWKLTKFIFTIFDKILTIFILK